MASYSSARFLELFLVLGVRRSYPLDYQVRYLSIAAWGLIPGLITVC